MPTDNKNSMTNVEQAEKYWQQFLTAPALTDDDKAIAKQHHDVLLTAFARSSFLAETLIQKPSFISCIVEQTVEQTTDQDSDDQLQKNVDREASSPWVAMYRSALNITLETVKTEDDLLKALREYRNQEMARVTFLDVLNKQDISTSLERVSALADVLLTGAYHWIYQHLAIRYGTPQNNGEDMHMYILGMGKLGGKELNLSLIHI